MKFSYQAKSFKGEVKTGTLEAKDQHEVARFLRDQGFVLISAVAGERGETKGEAIGRFTLGGIIGKFFGVRLVEKMMFARHLSVMVGSGLSLDRAIEVLSRQASSRKFRKILIELGEDVRRGVSFGDALTKHPTEFNELFVSMVRVGEESGTLEKVLKVLSGQMQKDHELLSRVRGAMIYPAIIFTVMLGIGILMMILVVPKLAEVFADLDIELPPTTRTIIFLGNFLAHNTVLVLISIPVLIFFIRVALSSTQGKKVLDIIAIKSPLISGITKKVNTARFARTLGSLVRSGVPIVRTLEILSGTLTNHYYKDSILSAIERVKKGDSLSVSLGDYPRLYPPIVIQMLAVGEETGALAEIMQRLARFYEAEVTDTTRNLSSIIEPILMVAIGAAVGFFAVSMIQPMYSMLGSL